MVINLYAESLKKEGASKATIKNYLTDVRQYLAWREKSNSDSVNNFLKESSGSFSASSLRRKASAIKKYLHIERNHYSMPKAKYIYPPYFIFGILVLIFSAATITNNQSAFNDKVKDTILSSANYPLEETTKNLFNANISGKDIKIALTEKPLKNVNYISEADINNEISIRSLTNYKKITQGSSKIANGKRYAIIINEFVDSNSFIYITPKSPTNNQVLYIEEQGDGYFVVSVPLPADKDIDFIWKVDNMEIYGS